MRFAFNSQQYGTTVEISFEATHLDQIRDMFDQFLRGSGFHFEDEEEISATADKTEISGIADDEFDITAVHSPDGNEVRITLTPKNTADKQEPVAWMNKDGWIGLYKQGDATTPLYTAPPKREWVGLTDDAIDLMAHNSDEGDWNSLIYRDLWTKGYLQGVKDAQDKLKERNT
jgi:hypothetical protein